MSAQTLQLKFKVSVEGRPGEAEGSLLLGRGNRCKLEFKSALKVPLPTRAELRSNGQKMRIQLETGRAEQDVPDNWNRIVTLALARAGLAASLEYLFVVPVDNPSTSEERLSFRGIGATSNLSIKGLEKIAQRNASVVGFTTALRDASLDMKIPASITLWLDAESCLPLKRLSVLEVGGDVLSIKEEYQDLRVNEKIDSAKFDLP